MNTKRMMRWVIVLFLLAVLPVMTAALAQEEEPGVKAPLPEVTEPGESQAPVWNIQESEPNNSMGQANYVDLSDVMRASFNPGGDVDYFKFFVDHGFQILIDTDARSIGSTSDTEVTLYNAAGNELGYNDDVDGSNNRDSMLYRVPKTGWYYVKVEDYYGQGCSSDCFYNLIVSSPLLISAAAANLGTGNVAGIPFQSQDVLAHTDLNDGQEKWVMFLDGSDVGFTKPLVNLATGWVYQEGASSSLVVGFSANQVLTDLHGVRRTFKPQDWAVFNIDQVGPNTQISDIEHHSGAEHGLTTTSEKIDALVLRDYWNFSGVIEVYLSTVGAAAVPKWGGGTQKFADEDLFMSMISTTFSGWNNQNVLDGSRVTGLGAEDVFAADFEGGFSRAYLTILGTGNILGHSVTQKDIFRLDYQGSEVWNWDGVVWHGPDHGWNYNIDAIDWPGG